MVAVCECLDYDDGTRHTCEACVGDLEMFRDALARSESARGEAEETSADLERRLGELLDRLTNGLYSKTGYSVDQMEQMVDEAYQKLYESALASERSAREAAERERDRQIGVGKEMTDLYCGSLARAEAAERERDEKRDLADVWRMRCLAAESSLSRTTEALRGLMKAFRQLHHAVGTGSHETWPEYEAARAALAGQEKP